MLKNSRKYLANSLQISSMWRNVIQPCIQLGRNNQEWLLPAVVSVQVVAIWYQDFDENTLDEVNQELSQLLEMGNVLVSFVDKYFNHG